METISNHPIHPWYGPCDGFIEGNNCSECKRIVDEQEAFLNFIHSVLGEEQRIQIYNSYMEMKAEKNG